MWTTSHRVYRNKVVEVVIGKIKLELHYILVDEKIKRRCDFE